MPNIIHTTKKNKIQAIIIIVVFLCIYIAGMVSVLLFMQNRAKIDVTDFDPSLMDAAIRPAGDKLTGIYIPEETDKDGQIDLAIQLINTANYNLQHDNKVAYAVNSNTVVMGVATGGIRYYIKNGNEFFNADYFYVPQGGAGTIAKKMDPKNTNYGYRMYYNLSTHVGYEQKSTELSFEKDIFGNIKFGVDWDILLFENKIEEIPAEFAASSKAYRYYNYDWTKESILTASVTYNADEGYYEMVVTIDAENEEAIKDGLEVLRAGAGDESAVYTSITETVQIWDNGRYKQFNTYDKWKSPNIHGLHISTSSANDYKTTFYYDDYSLNIKNYQYSNEFIEYIENK